MAAAELNFEVHNYMEDIVFDLIQQKQQSDPDFDFCPRCVLDIGALVLNIIKPQYIKVATKFADLDHAPPMSWSGWWIRHRKGAGLIRITD